LLKSGLSGGSSDAKLVVKGVASLAPNAGG